MGTDEIHFHGVNSGGSVRTAACLMHCYVQVTGPRREPVGLRLLDVVGDGAGDGPKMPIATQERVG